MGGKSWLHSQVLCCWMPTAAPVSQTLIQVCSEHPHNCSEQTCHKDCSLSHHRSIAMSSQHTRYVCGHMPSSSVGGGGDDLIPCSHKLPVPDAWSSYVQQGTRGRELPILHLPSTSSLRPRQALCFLTHDSKKPALSSQSMFPHSTLPTGAASSGWWGLESLCIWASGSP